MSISKKLRYFLAIKNPVNVYIYRVLFNWAGWGLNPRPNDYESSALTAELPARIKTFHNVVNLYSCKHFFEEISYFRKIRHFTNNDFLLFVCALMQILKL